MFRSKKVNFICVKLRHILPICFLAFSNLAVADKDSTEASLTDCIVCLEAAQSKATINLRKIELKPMVFRPGDEGRLYKVVRTDPKESDVPAEININNPLRSVGRIEAKRGDSKWTGTSFFISPCHILTAAHVVYSKEDESRLFSREGDADSLKDGEALKLLNEINLNLKSKNGKRSLDFNIVRNSSGQFDPFKALKAEEILWMDPKSDYAVIRVDKCLGVPEAFGQISILASEEFDPEFKKISGQKVPLVSACYPGDQKENQKEADTLRINSSTKYSKFLDNELKHQISTNVGCSGAPIIAMFYKMPNGERIPIDRDFIKKQNGNIDYSKVQTVLVALHKEGKKEVNTNYAKLMNDDNVMSLVTDDMESNKVMLMARIEEAKRER